MQKYERKKIKNSTNNLEIDHVPNEKTTISFLLKWTKSPDACKIFIINHTNIKKIVKPIFLG